MVPKPAPHCVPQLVPGAPPGPPPRRGHPIGLHQGAQAIVSKQMGSRRNVRRPGAELAMARWQRRNPAPSPPRRPARPHTRPRRAGSEHRRRSRTNPWDYTALPRKALNVAWAGGCVHPLFCQCVVLPNALPRTNRLPWRRQSTQTRNRRSGTGPPSATSTSGLRHTPAWNQAPSPYRGTSQTTAQKI